MTKGYPIFEWIPGTPIIDKDDNKKVNKMKYLQHTKTSTMMKSLKMENMKKSLKKRYTIHNP